MYIYLLTCVLFRISDVIGSGEFSHVYQALWHHDSGKDVRVAVKATKEGASEDERTKFLQEAAIMGQFDHPYIITIFGIMVDPLKVMHFLGGLRLTRTIDYQ